MLGALQKKLIPILLGILCVIGAVLFRVTSAEPFSNYREQVDNLFYDFQVKMLQNKKALPDNPIVIADIDEKSLSRFGSWPWSRGIVAKFVDVLQKNGVLVVAFDVVFPSEEKNIVATIKSGLNKQQLNSKEFIEHLNKIENNYNYDQQLADVFAKGDTVLGIILHNRSDAVEGTMPPPIFSVPKEMLKTLTLIDMPGVTANVNVLQQSAKNVGFVTTVPDIDGVIRFSPLVMRYHDGVYLSLALEAARLYLLADKVDLDIKAIGNRQVLEGIYIGKTYIPTDAYGRVLVPYRGLSHSYPYYSVVDIMDGKIKKEQLENKIIFVGTSALGMGDLRATPKESVYPGVEIHANIADGIIQQKFPTKPAWAIGAEIIIIVVSGLLMALLFPFLRPFFLNATIFVVPMGLILLNRWFWEHQGLVLSFVVPMFLVIVLAIVNLAYGFIFENRAKRVLRWMFGQYVPAQHIEQIIKNPGDYAMSGESREMSVLFADIRNFTSISEKLDAIALKNLLNQFLTPMTKIIFDNGGTIDKYVGDMIMAFWGAPIHEPLHAEKSIAAGLAMLEMCALIKKQFQQQGLPEISIGIGINSGIMSVGDMGSEYRRSYTVLGDAVNLASRLESLTKFYDVNLIVGENTRNGQDDFIFHRLDRVKVKGKDQSIEIFQPIGLRKTIDSSVLVEMAIYEQALNHYFLQQWDLAEALFKQLKQQNPNKKLYQLYLDRIDSWREVPPPADWDGAYVRNEK